MSGEEGAIAAEAIANAAQEETRGTLQRIEGTLTIILSSQLELSGRMAKIEGEHRTPSAPTAEGHTVYPAPYVGPERRRDRMPAPAFVPYDTLSHVKEETDKQTPILQSMPPMMQTANNRLGYTMIVLIVQTLAAVAYALAHTH